MRICSAAVGDVCRVLNAAYSFGELFYGIAEIALNQYLHGIYRRTAQSRYKQISHVVQHYIAASRDSGKGNGRSAARHVRSRGCFHWMQMVEDNPCAGIQRVTHAFHLIMRGAEQSVVII
ncbi:hypothetical protein SDC9_200335 [bioreactor metagenome]|uniref:Uncharacterized protein n=1 Tax=bioreactor metagenome TaxID=1076179 RepID=A0A645IZP4_9ZZZZ